MKMRALFNALVAMIALSMPLPSWSAEIGQGPIAAVVPEREQNPAKVAAQSLAAELQRRRVELEERERRVAAREQAVKLAQETLMAEVRQLLAEVARYERCAGITTGAAEKGRNELSGVPILVAAILSLPPRKAVPLLLKSEPRVVSEVVRQLGNEKTTELLKQMSTTDATRFVGMINAGAPEKKSLPSSTTPASGRSARKEKK